MNEFFQLYQTDYEGALKCFTDNTFISWLDRNEYEQEIEFYNQVKGSGQHIALQNFLCLLNFDVNPVLDMEYMKGILTLKNKGTGYLYGRVECSKGVKADISEWDQQKNIVKIRTSKPGFVKVISNGGTLVQQVDAETGNDKPFSVIEKNISILRNRFKIKIDSLKEDPVISVDNNFVYVTYDLQDCAVTARKNIPLIKLIWSRLKKIQLYSNVKLICKGCIIHIRIRIA
jgi:hypothetical protein